MLPESPSGFRTHIRIRAPQTRTHPYSAEYTSRPRERSFADTGQLTWRQAPRQPLPYTGQTGRVWVTSLFLNAAWISLSIQNFPTPLRSGPCSESPPVHSLLAPLEDWYPRRTTPSSLRPSPSFPPQSYHPPYLVIVGDGPLRNDLQLLSRDLGIADRVKLIGARQDVRKLLLGLFGVFAFPSKFEGLGLAAIEAQAAGLPCVISSSVPSSAIIVPENVSYLPVSVEPAEWARELVRKHNAPRLPRKLALLRALSSSYSIERSVQRLYHFYGLQPNHA